MYELYMFLLGCIVLYYDPVQGGACLGLTIVPLDAVSVATVPTQVSGMNTIK